MVEFCGACGTSLPKGDLTIRGGEIFTSADYVCPHCGKLANPAGGEKHEHPAPEADQDVVVKQGRARLE